MVSCSNCSAEIDYQYGSSHVACQECGMVISEGQLVSDGFQQAEYRANNFTFNAPKSYHIRDPNIIRISEGMSSCFQFAMTVCKSMGYAPFYDEVKMMITEVLKHDHFSQRRLENKKTITACCIYLVLRSRCRTVTFDDLQRHCQNIPANFEHWKSQLLQHFPKFLKISARASTSELASRLIESLKLNMSLLPRVNEILKLAESVWLTEGQKPESFVLGSCYLAWISEVPTERLKIKVTKFCRMHKIPEKISTMSKGVNLLLRVLKQLAEQIPWYRTETHSKDLTIVLYLSDILNYQKVLISEASKKLKELPISNVEHESEDVDISRSQEDSAYVIRKNLMKQRKKPINRIEDLEIKIPEGLDLMREEIDEHDMDEETLKEYLRLPEEIEVSENIKELLDVSLLAR